MTEKTDSDQEARLRAIRDRAAADFCASKTELRNPYLIGSPDYNEYERAWTQALKRSNLRYEDQGSSNWMPQEDAKPYQPPQVNEYARRKG